MPLDGSSAQKQLRSDLGVRSAIDGQPRDLQLLSGQLEDSLDRPPTHCLPGGRELTAGALSEGLHTHLGVRLVGEAQLLAGVYPAPLAAEPFAVEQMGARERNPDAGAAEPIDRVAIQPFGFLTRGQ